MQASARPRSTPGSADEISSSAGEEGDDDGDDVVDKILKEWMGVKEGGKGRLSSVRKCSPTGVQNCKCVFPIKP